MEVGERIKVLRKELYLTQTKFGDKIGFKQAVIGQMENNTRNITDRTVMLICEKYNVREQWLRNGTGSVFVETDKTLIHALADEYDLDSLDKQILECYLTLGAFQRKVLKDYLIKLVDAVNSDKTSPNEQQASTDNDIVQIPVASLSGEDTNITMRSEEYEAMEKETLKDLEKLDNSKIP